MNLEFWLEIAGLGLSVVGFAVMAYEWWAVVQLSNRQAANWAGSRGESAARTASTSGVGLAENMMERRDYFASFADLDGSKDQEAREQLRASDLSSLFLAASTAHKLRAEDWAQRYLEATDSLSLNSFRAKIFAIGASITVIGFILQFAARIMPVVGL